MLRIRELRERKGMSQEALARAAGVSLSTIARLEAGRSHGWPTTLRAIAGALGLKRIDSLYTAPEREAV